MVSRRRRLLKAVRLAVLTEAGYRCAVPTCRTILAIDLHHLVWVSDGGPDDASNLLALCPTCHALHHRGEIPREALLIWKRTLADRMAPVPATAGSARTVRDQLRVLYLHASPRSDGLDYLRSPQLVRELEGRGHILRFCWAVHADPLVNDTAGLGRDLLTPEAVRDWNPDALVFEDGLFVGDPKMPAALLDDLEAQGTVAVIEIPPYKYHGRKDEYDSFLKDRAIEVEIAEHEPPSCRSFSGHYLATPVDVLRKYSSLANDSLFEGVNSVVAASASPLRAWSKILLVGGDDVLVKAYGNRRIHGDPHPIYGVLVERNMRTEAVFLAHVLFDSPECPDNAKYITNLLEWMHRMRAESLAKGANAGGA